MKKNLIVILSFATILLAGCFDSNQVTKIEWEEIAAAQQTFVNQLDEAQYIKDLENFLSYNVLSITQDKPFTSDFSVSIDFDKDSSIQWWIDLSQKKVSKSHDLESADITIDINTNMGEAQNFDLYGDVTLLYKNNEMYANLHEFDIYMWEGNMAAKMYKLLSDMLVNNWVNLEVHSWWFISLDENELNMFPHIVWTIKNILKTENVQSSPNFVWSIAELIDATNSYVDLWISANELKLTNHEVTYFKHGDKTIQKIFTGSFEWKDSAFDLSFDVSKKWVDVHLYNMKQNNEDTWVEFVLSIQEKWNSEYDVVFQVIENQEKVADLKWKIKCADTVSFSANFGLNSDEFIPGEKVSWKINGSVIKKSWDSGKEIPELTESILSLSEIMSSL